MFWCCCNSVTAEQVEYEAATTEIIPQRRAMSTPSPFDDRPVLDEEAEAEAEAEIDQEAATYQARGGASMPRLLGATRPRVASRAASKPLKPLSCVEAAEEAADEEEEDEDETQPPRPGPFDLTLEMVPGERLGALLDVLDLKTLRVKELRSEGRLRTYNARAQAHRQVLPGDFIVAVNGTSGGAEQMVEEMRRSRTWQLRVARKEEFIVELEKTGHLCLDLQFEKESDCIVIRKIGDVGSVKKYNEGLADGEPQVRVGDRIMAVNEVASRAADMIEVIQGEATQLQLTISRPQW